MHREVNRIFAIHHDVGTCLRHVSMQSSMYQRVGNMPKACPYAMALFFCDLTHPPLRYGVTLFVSAASLCVGGLVLFSGLHLIGYVLGPGVDVVGEFGGVGQVYLHIGAYA